MNWLYHFAVNTCRFASVLTPVARHSTETTPHTTAVPAPDLPMFAIVKLCFFHTLTKRHEPLDTYNESNMKAGQLQRCFTVNPHVEKSNSDILKELYRRFDELVKDVISYIIKHDVTSIDDRRNYFCCTINNLNNLLINICGYDFNVSMPTKNNIEFRVSTCLALYIYVSVNFQFNLRPSRRCSRTCTRI